VITFDDILSELYPLLNASGSSDLIWWTTTELYAWMEEASRRLGTTGAFTARASIAVSSGGAAYSMPAQVLSVIHVSLDGSALRPINVAELEALSTTWDTDSGTVSRFALDVNGTAIVTLYKIPADSGSIQIIVATWPTAASGYTHRAPAVFGLYHKYATLAAARAKDGDGQAPDVAAAARARADVIMQACRGLWGGAK
jgi:hypothetical protein